MTHMTPMPESSGTFGDDWKPCERKCPKCSGPVVYRTWESSCGGYEDDKFKCTKCGHTWWVDGCDS
jgi:hypothetical protein